MRRVPLPAKLAMTTVVSCGMSYLMYCDHLYDEETYRVALKFREKFQETAKNEKELV